MEGTRHAWVADKEEIPARRNLFSRQTSHSPVGPGVPPQAHLRRKTLARADVKDISDLGFDREERRVPIFPIS